MKGIIGLISAVCFILIASCVNTEYKSREHSNKIDVSRIDKSIDSIGELSADTDSKMYRRLFTIDSIFYKQKGRIDKNRYDDIKRFHYASEDMDRELYAYMSEMIVEIERVPDFQADTLRPFQMRNRGDKSISYRYSNKNIFKLTVKVKSFLSKHKITKTPDLPKFEREMLNPQITFEDRYLMIKVLIQQLKDIEYNYFNEIINTPK